jgi:hypothetical protein
LGSSSTTRIGDSGVGIIEIIGPSRILDNGDTSMTGGWTELEWKWLRR